MTWWCAQFDPSDPFVNKMRFWCDYLLVRTESIVPYAMVGDDPPGNYFAWNPCSDTTYKMEAQGISTTSQVVETKSIVIWLSRHVQWLSHPESLYANHGPAFARTDWTV